MKNVYLIPTDKPSRLIYNDANQLCYQSNKSFKNDRKNRKKFNIYITNDGEIKDGDWMIRCNEQPIKVTKDFFWDFGVRYYKIILTTDPDLINDGVQAIDDEFLEWVINNPNHESVKVRSKMNHPRSVFGYEIIIP